MDPRLFIILISIPLFVGIVTHLNPLFTLVAVVGAVYVMPYARRAWRRDAMMVDKFRQFISHWLFLFRGGRVLPPRSHPSHRGRPARDPYKAE
jgi:hypothetical protein